MGRQAPLMSGGLTKRSSLMRDFSRRLRAGLVITAVVLATCVATTGTAGIAAAATGTAPGAPGGTALWTPGDKQGFGTSTSTASKVWYTLGRGELSEVYYPDLGTPAVRDLRFAVTDGRTYIGTDRDDATHAVHLLDAKSLTYQQVDTDKGGRWRLTKSFITDPARSALQSRCTSSPSPTPRYGSTLSMTRASPRTATTTPAR